MWTAGRTLTDSESCGEKVVNEDIGPILERWPYGDGTNVRTILGADGIEKVQIRVLLQGFHGILQFNCDGRPDGQRPHGRPFALDHYEELRRRQSKASTSPEPFTLTGEQAAELFEESSITYQRYIVLLQMNDYRRVIRDTARNMKVFRFVHEHAAEVEDRDRLEKWWPYIIRVHHTARIMLQLEEEDFSGAMRIIDEARRELENLAPQHDETFRIELDRSKKALDELAKAIDDRRPLSDLELLEREKDEAVRLEDYERAAELRDRIDDLKKQGEQQD